MTKISDEMIMAYVDGELEHEDVLAIENTLLVDASLREKVARHHALRAEIDLAFNSVDNTPIPEDILSLLQDDHNTTATGEVVSIDIAQKHTDKKQAYKSWWQPTSIAASFVIAFIIGMVIDGPDNTYDDFILTSNQFASLLNTSAGGTTNMGIEIQESFIKQDGSFCRTFQNRRSDNYSDGLSCREANGDWTLVALTPAIPADVYRPASGDSENVIQLVTNSMLQLTSEEEKNYLTK